MAPLLDDACLVQLVLNKIHYRLQMLYNMNESIAFEVQLLLHAMGLMSTEIEKKMVSIARHALICTLSAMAIQFV